jgi:hypothetical protein
MNAITSPEALHALTALRAELDSDAPRPLHVARRALTYAAACSTAEPDVFRVLVQMHRILTG